MTLPEQAALRYAKHGWGIFPCRPHGPSRKAPLTENGCLAASTNADIITAWWRKWPEALIGFATGCAHRTVVLDVDVKNNINGLDTLAELGFAILPRTPISHTPSGGIHLFFVAPEGIDLRNTEGDLGRGIGRGCDWRGDGGYAIVPSPGSGYSWDPHVNPQTTSFATVPPELLPREPPKIIPDRPSKAVDGLSPYAQGALDKACRTILNAPSGRQEATLNSECLCIGSLAGSGAIPAAFARATLRWAALQIPSYDPKRPWRQQDIEAKVNRSFDDGLRRPRGVRYA